MSALVLVGGLLLQGTWSWRADRRCRAEERGWLRVALLLFALVQIVVWIGLEPFSSAPVSRERAIIEIATAGWIGVIIPGALVTEWIVARSRRRGR